MHRAPDRPVVRLQIEPGLFRDALSHVLQGDGMVVLALHDRTTAMPLHDGDRMVSDVDLPTPTGGGDMVLLPEGAAGPAFLISAEAAVMLDSVEDLRARWRWASMPSRSP